MTWRTRRCSYRRQLHLTLEPLEDRTALSNLGTLGVADPVPSIASSTYLAAAIPTPVPNSPNYSVSQSPVANSPSSASSANAAASSASSSDDDSSYGANLPTTTSNSSASSVDTPMTVTPGTTGGSPSTTTASTSSSANYGSVSTSNRTDGQTGMRHGSYYPQAQAQGTPNAYGADGYENEYYAVHLKRLAEIQAELVTGNAVVRELVRERAPASTNFETESPQPAPESAPAVLPPTDAASPVASAKANDPEFVPSLRHPASESSSELLAAGDERRPPQQDADSSFATLVSADESAHPCIPEPGTLASGAISVDLDALARDVDRFFTHLDQQGRRLLAWVGTTNFGSWLASAAAATAVFEIARRAARKPTPSVAGLVSWQGDRRFTDTDQLFFFGADEP